MLTLEQGSPWYCVLPRDRWGQNGEPSESLVAAIEKDFVDQVVLPSRARDTLLTSLSCRSSATVATSWCSSDRT